MNPTLAPLLSSLLLGSAAALGVYGGRGWLGEGFAWIERDVGDKLRALRIAPKNLRRWLIAWAVTMGSILVVLGLVFQSLVPAVLICLLLAALPWYLVRR